MKVQFNTRHQEALGLRDWALGRTVFVLRRMAWRVSAVSVQMSDVDGLRHGVDKRCQVTIVPDNDEPVIVTATARDWHTALNQALSRAIESLKRLLKRPLAARRGALPAPDRGYRSGQALATARAMAPH